MRSPELQRVCCELERATCDFSEEDWLWAPAEKWSCALIVEHLLLSYLSTTLGLLRAIHSGKPSATEVTLRNRIAAFVVTGIGYFPVGRPAPKQAVPKGSLPPGSLQKVVNAVTVMDTRLLDAERRFGSNAKVLDHPILGPLTAKQWRRFHYVHTMHHLKQIKQRGRGRA